LQDQISKLESELAVANRSVSQAQSTNQLALDDATLEHRIFPPSQPAAPGGVAGPNFLVWLKANAGTNTTTDNAPVNFWNDESNSNNHARQTISDNSRPLFQKDTGNLINFNPVLSFDSVNDYLRVNLDVSPQNRNPLSTAIVYRPTSGGGLYGNDDTGWDLAHDTSYVGGNNSSKPSPEPT